MSCLLEESRAEPDHSYLSFIRTDVLAIVRWNTLDAQIALTLSSLDALVHLLEYVQMAVDCLFACFCFFLHPLLLCGSSTAITAVSEKSPDASFWYFIL